MVFRLAHPAALLLLLLPVMIGFILRPRPLAALRYSDTRLMVGLPISWRVRFRLLPDILLAGAWVILVITLARPQTGRTQEILRGQGVDIVLALDISGSMKTEDMGGQSRLNAAKSVITDFIASRESDRIGLVVFARQAFHQSPLTLDYGILTQLLNEIQPASELGLEEGTAIGLGLASSANMLRHSDALSKVIVLLTDGAHNAEGISPVDAALSLATLGIRVYTIGVGSSEPVPIVTSADGRTQFVENGLDEATLGRIADITHGHYFRAVDLADLQAVYDQINVLEKSDIERQVFVRWQDQAAAFLLPFSLILLVLERLLRWTTFQTVP
ncbi:MAG: VWA domain-containing protein [Anaerolineae bacterium]|nr:VWA domain-containing protein [Anaerolineae bacterium]